MIALPALWVGILYDASAREAAAELTRRWKFSDLLQFQAEVARHALRAKGPGGSPPSSSRATCSGSPERAQGRQKLSGLDEIQDPRSRR